MSKAQEKIDQQTAAATADFLRLGQRLEAAEQKIAQLQMRLRKLEKLKSPRDEPQDAFRVRVLKALGAKK